MKRTINSSYEIILVGGFEFDKLRRQVPVDIKLIRNHDYLETNVAHSIELGLRQAIGTSVIVIYGDLVFQKKALEVELQDQSKVLTSSFMKDREVGCTTYDGLLEQIFYDLDNKWAQIAYFTGQELKILRSTAAQDDNCNKFGFELINRKMSMCKSPNEGNYSTITKML